MAGYILYNFISQVLRSKELIFRWLRIKFQTKRAKQIKKILHKLVVAAVVFNTIVIVSGAVLAKIYEKQVKDFIISSLTSVFPDKKLTYQSVNFSVLRHFPNASFEFRNMLALSQNDFNKKEFSEKQVDTLLKINSLTLEFNSFDIFRGTYILTKIHFRQGFVSIFIDKLGKDNFHIWKPFESTGEAYQIKLNNLSFSDIKLTYINHIKHLDLHSTIKGIRLWGNFSDKKQQVRANALLAASRLNANRQISFRAKEVEAKLVFSTNGNNYKIKKALFLIDNQVVNLAGSINSTNEIHLDLKCRAEKIDLKTAYKFFQKKFLKDFLPAGKLNFQADIRGIWSEKSAPNLLLHFDLSHGVLARKNSKIKINSLITSGLLLINQHKQQLVIDSLRAKFGGGFIRASLRAENFSTPQIQLILDSKTKLHDWKKYLALDSLNTLRGELVLSGKTSFKSLNFNEIHTDFLNAKVSRFSGSLRDFQFQLTVNSMAVDNLFADYQFSDKQLVISNLDAEINKQKIQGQASVKNIADYLQKTEKLVCELKLTADKLQIEKLQQPDNKPVKSDSVSIKLPANIEIAAKIKVHNLKFQNWQIGNFETQCHFFAPNLTFKVLKGSTLDGSFSTNLNLVQLKNNNFKVRGELHLKHLNINQLFSKANNFEQTILMDKNIRGSLNSTMSFQLAWDSSFNFQPEQINLRGKLQILDGELIKLEILNELSRFIRLKQLENIHFSTLENNFVIRKQRLFFEEMNIKSTAFNILVSGMHSFENQFTYTIKLSLFKSFLRKLKSQAAKEFTIDDKLEESGIYLSITGDSLQYKIGFNKQKIRDIISDRYHYNSYQTSQLLKKSFLWTEQDTLINTR